MAIYFVIFFCFFCIKKSELVAFFFGGYLPTAPSFHIKMLYIQICFFNEKLKDLLESLFIFSIKCSFFKAVYIKHSQ